ncbi:uncharacterized protein LOC108050751 [Drosophila rhopaloa]|uniref:Uncharacterized protein LOC108050751 n=1 Tax=Drosophila rhopaloa TaxID=1041015 RepID=A0A6P4FKW8_DRORH|nr:uncharacterized protein LOC108050751 [Drosophila rhopaloa]
MQNYGVLEGVLLAVTSLIILWVQGFVALPLATPVPESLPLAKAEDNPVIRAPRQANWNHSMEWDPNTQMQQKADGFRVFGKKLQDDYHRRTGYNETREPPTAVTKGTTTGRMRITKGGIKLFAAPKDKPKERSGGKKLKPKFRDGEGEEGEAEAGAEGEGGAAEGGTTGGDGEQEKELTISIPKFSTNQYGENVYNPWGMTFGNQFLDTRFGPGNPQMQRLSINPNPPQNYYPSMENLTSVCANQSTIYNELKIEKWLMRHVYSRKKMDRPFFLAMRREIYEKGDSEQCHTAAFSDWQQYQECAVRRNQRMEYYVPKYPRHQLAVN